MNNFKNSIILTAASAVLLAFCFFPLPLLYKIIVPYLIFIPMFYIFKKRNSLKKFFTIGFVFGSVMFAILLYWMFILKIEDVNPWLIRLGAFLLVMFIGIQYGIGFLIFGWIKKKYNVVWPFIAVFPLIEFWRGLGPSFGFQWGIIPLTQSYFPYVIQYADLIGVYGITTVIIAVNYLLFKYISTKKIKYTIYLIVIIITVVVYGMFSLHNYKGYKSIKIGIVQPNVAPYIKHRADFINERFERLENMSKELADSEVNMIVWPETASPVYLNYRKDLLRRIQNFVDSINIPILTGTPIVDFEHKGPVKYYNGAMLLLPRDSVEIYRKILPVPFVERMPYADKFSFMKKIDLGEGDYSVGQEYTVFSADNIKFSVIICFESMFEILSREFTKRGAEFLVNITEDAWFGKTSFSYMHNSFLPIRAIENRRTIVRCANTGISGRIDQWGRMHDKTSIFTKSILSVKIDLLNEKSIYTKAGYYFPELLLLILLLYMIYPFFRRLYENKKH